MANPFRAFLLILIAPSALWAHAYLVKSVPAQRAVLYRSPQKIQLWFNERLEPGYATVSVVDDKGNAVTVGSTEVAKDDPKHLSVTIDSLPAGRYWVKYRVLSVDGHVAQDQFPFTVKQ